MALAPSVPRGVLPTQRPKIPPKPLVPLRPGYTWVFAGGRWQTTVAPKTPAPRNVLRPIVTKQGKFVNPSAPPGGRVIGNAPTGKAGKGRVVVHGPTGHTVAVGGPDGVNTAPGSPPRFSTGTPAGRGGAGGGDLYSQLLSMLTTPDGSADTSNTSATALVNASYAPQIAELASQMARANTAAANSQQNIGDWFTKAQADNQATIPGIDAETQNLLANEATANQHALEALGGGASDAAGSLAAFQAINANELAQHGQTAHDYAAGMTPVLALQGSDAKSRQAQADASAMQDLVAQMADVQGKKTADMISANQDATSQSQKDKIAMVNELAQLAMLPGQLKGQNLANLAKAAGIRATNTNNQLNQLRLKLGLQNAGGGSTGAIPTWNTLNPQQLDSLRTDLVSTVVSKQNPNLLAVDPIYVFNQMGNQIRSVSNGQWDPKTNAQVNAWRNGILAQYLPLWNQKHPNARYQIQNGTLVRLKPKKK